VNPQNKANRIQILVADSNAMFCELVQRALHRRRGFNVVACATSLRELVTGLDSNNIDIALVGANLKDGKGSGVRAVQRMRSLRPQIRSVVLVESSDPGLALEAFRAGAKGVFRRSEADIDLLSKCVLRVHEGQVWASSVELEQLLEAFRSPAPLPIPATKGAKLLTQQEARIAGLVAKGSTNREIAAQLHLSEHTVKNYLFKIFDRLGISNRVELVLYAMSQPEPRNEGAPTANSSSPRAS
jgi:DNA-binding NarL/FixJ family response regulator